MIKEAIEKIEAMAITQTLEIEGRTYTNKQIHPVMEPGPQTLGVSTLTGFVDYIAANVDKLKFPEAFMVQVKDYNQVRLISCLTDKFMVRNTYITAHKNTADFHFGNFMDLESFIIRLQSMFVQDWQTELILRIVGNIGDGLVRNFSDDGVTQQVTVKTGPSRVDNIPVSNLLELTPYRTFFEIEQPVSRFVFRMRSGKEAPECALFEADGGMWINEAILKIRDWLKDRVGGIAVIA